MKKIFIATSSFGEGNQAIFKSMVKAKLLVTMNPYARRLNEDEIASILSQGAYEGLLAGLEPLTKKVFLKAKNLKVISRVGVGLDNVDQVAARDSGIKVFNTPGVLTDAVAELTLGMILTSLRKIVSSDHALRSGKWQKNMGFLLKDKLLGLIGFGNIGARVAELANAFGARIIFYDIQKIKDTQYKQVSLTKLMQTADIISLHSSSQDCLISDNEIKKAKKGVFIVNTARGCLIDEKALLKALRSGKIAYAALDVFETEPYQGELCKYDNVILTPHIGSYAQEARMLMEKMAVDNLIKGLKTVKRHNNL